MNHFNRKRFTHGRWRAVATGLLAIALAGCAATGSKEVVAEDAEARSKQRWEALLAKDYATAYEYLTPAQRAKLTPERYAAQTSVLPVKWSSADVLDAECEEDRCEVRVDLGFRVRSHLPGVGWIDSKRIVVEKWLRLGGAWYYLPESAS